MSKTKRLTEIAVCVAMAVVCSFIKIWEMPQGGSVSLTMVPIVFIAYKRGTMEGVVTGAVYGMLSVLLAGVIYHPASVLLDYVLAFAAVGLSGVIRRGKRGIILGSMVGVGARFICSFISGAVIFSEYAPEGTSPWLYSLIYQASYMLPELIITVAILLLLYTKAHRIFEL